MIFHLGFSVLGLFVFLGLQKPDKLNYWLSSLVNLNVINRKLFNFARKYSQQTKPVAVSVHQRRNAEDLDSRLWLAQGTSLVWNQN